MHHVESQTAVHLRTFRSVGNTYWLGRERTSEAVSNQQPTEAFDSLTTQNGE